MNNIRILSLRIENFKGIKLVDLQLDGQNIKICGRNGSGKTTHYDALTWLLFGKDSKGNAKFDIKPVKMQKGIMPTVSAVLSVDGELVKLKKTYRERWESVRGRTEKHYAGNTTDYEIDDVPLKENEYKKRISDIVDEETFRLLTNVYLFCRDYTWKQRRTILFDMCHLQSDSELIASNPVFADLQIGNRTVDDYRKLLQKEIKNHNVELNTVPVRIDECLNIIQKLDCLDFEAAQAKKEADETELADLRKQLSLLLNDTVAQNLENQINALKNDRKKLELENEQHRTSQIVPVEDKRPAIRLSISNYDRLIDDLEHSKKRIAMEIDQQEKNIAKCRERWIVANNKAFNGDTTCPTCGQTLPPKMLEKAKADFEAQKAEVKKEQVEQSESYKKQLAICQEKLANLVREIENAAEKRSELAIQLAGIKEPEMQPVEDMPDFGEKMENFAKKIAEKESDLEKLQTSKRAEKGVIAERIKGKEQDIAANNIVLSKKELLKESESRIEELERKARVMANEAEKLETQLSLCEEFIRFKAASLEGNVNGLFDKARFRLFTDNISNDGLKDCCDVMMDGKPYGTLSDGEKVKIGMDVIRTLSGHYGVSVPLFVDGAESVTDMPDTDAQKIELIVEDSDLYYES
jgi:DNA repair exonuclease SbcCD ATPase subunit